MPDVSVIESATRFGAPPDPQGRRRRRFRRLLLLVGGLAVVGAAVWAVGWSPLLAVQEVRVLGTHTVSPAQVRAAAGVSIGTPLARVSSSDVQSRVDAIGPVASVEVRHGWPHVLVLVVTEREPVAAVRAPGGFELVDRTGFAYAPVSARPDGIPELTATGDALTASVTVLSELPDSLRAQVRSVSAGSAADVRLVLADRTQVRWGGAVDAARKAAVLLALLPQRARTIDVSAPDLPTTRGTR